MPTLNFDATADYCVYGNFVVRSRRLAFPNGTHCFWTERRAPLAGRSCFHEALEQAPGRRADDAVDDNAVPEQDHRGRVRDEVAGGERWPRLRVDVGHLDPIRRGLREARHDRRDAVAGL